MCWTTKEKPSAKVVPYEERSCTDILWFLLFVAGWIAIIVMFATAVHNGDPDRTIRGVQYDNKICGKSPAVSDKRYAGFPYPPQPDFQVCLKSCDETQTDSRFILNYQSKSIFYFCIPTAGLSGGSLSVNITLGGDFASASDQVSRAFGDIYTAWQIILGSAFVALGFAFFYSWLVKYIAKFMVFVALLLIVIGGIILSYALLKKAQEYEDDPAASTRYKTVRGLGIVVACLTFIFVCLCIFLRNRIKLAAGVISEAGAALSDMKALFFWPVVPFLLALCYIAWFCFVSLYIFSVGSTNSEPIPSNIRYKPTDVGQTSPLYPETTWTTFTWNTEYKKAFAANFFHMLWNLEFIIYFSFMVTTGAVASWYFTPFEPADSWNKPRGNGPNQLSNSPVRDSLKRTVRFHIGTLAVGAFLLALVDMARAILTYMQHKMKNESNTLQRVLFCLAQCCLKCVDCCVDKLNKNAFIWTAVFGDSFATAACSAFALLFRNILRVAVIDLVGVYLLFVGKVFTAVCTTAFAAFVMTFGEPYKTDLSSIAVPCFIVFVLAWLVASVFMAVLDTTIDTTFLCFLIDEEHNKGFMYAHKSLIQLVDKYQEHAKNGELATSPSSPTTNTAAK